MRASEVNRAVAQMEVTVVVQQVANVVAIYHNQNDNAV